MVIRATDLRADTNPASMEAIVRYLLENGINFGGAVPNPPDANTLYKHPNAGGQIAVALDASSTEAAVAGVLDAAQGGIAAGALEDWHEIGASSEPGFANSWVNKGGALATTAFRKLPSGLVVIKGVVISGSVGAAAFTLPVGYRPSKTENFAAFSQDGGGFVLGRIIISGSGNFTPSDGGNIYFPISCQFMAGA